MYFPTVFRRSKPLTSPYPVLGGDGAPGVPPSGVSATPGGQDNLLLAKPMNNVGAPTQRVGVLYKGPVAAVALVAQLWIYDHASEGWYEVGAPGTVTPNRISYFDILAIADAVQLGANSQPSGGGIPCMLVVQSGATPDGTYTFGMAADLSVTI